MCGKTTLPNNAIICGHIQTPRGHSIVTCRTRRSSWTVTGNHGSHRWNTERNGPRQKSGDWNLLVHDRLRKRLPRRRIGRGGDVATVRCLLPAASDRSFKHSYHEQRSSINTQEIRRRRISPHAGDGCQCCVTGVVVPNEPSFCGSDFRFEGLVE